MESTAQRAGQPGCVWRKPPTNKDGCVALSHRGQKKMGDHYWQMHGHNTTGSSRVVQDCEQEGPWDGDRAPGGRGRARAGYRARQRLLRGLAALQGMVGETVRS